MQASRHSFVGSSYITLWCCHFFRIPNAAQLVISRERTAEQRNIPATMAIPKNIAAAFTWELAAYTSLACWVVYAVCLGVYRLWYSPIAHLPGPKLAALTQYYEFYYDIILGGQYTFRIVEMHKQYGPVVRISPWEVHVSDHGFHSELYPGPHRRRHKWLFWAKQVRKLSIVACACMVRC